jgi:acyl transferase domain-containing protein
MTRIHLTDRDIAVVGLACRVPGADGPDGFWQLLISGGSAIGAVLPERSTGDPSGRARLLAAAAERAYYSTTITRFGLLSGARSNLWFS